MANAKLSEIEKRIYEQAIEEEKQALLKTTKNFRAALRLKSAESDDPEILIPLNSRSNQNAYCKLNLSVILKGIRETLLDNRKPEICKQALENFLKAYTEQQEG